MPGRKRGGADRAAEVVRRLRAAYPPGHSHRPVPERRDPLRELIFTVLSQNTSDLNRDRAWASMRKAFPNWDATAAADPGALTASIAVGGLANTKAPRIQAILHEVRSREGRYSLARLARLGDDEVAAYLVSLPGIGPKTAACVLAFSLGRPRLPVDTHVHRVAERLELVPPGSKPEGVQTALEALVRPSDRLDAHVTLIAHGRTACRARRPLCGECSLFDLCPSGPALLRSRT